MSRTTGILLAILTTVAVAVIAVASTGTADDAARTNQQGRAATRAATRADLAGHDWAAKRYRRHGTWHHTAAHTRFTLDFAAARRGHRALGLSFGTGCNSGGGRVLVRHGRLSTRRLITTLMACTGARGRQDRVFERLLQGHPRARIGHGRLVLRSGHTTIRFRRVDTATTPKGFEQPR